MLSLSLSLRMSLRLRSNGFVTASPFLPPRQILGSIRVMHYLERLQSALDIHLGDILAQSEGFLNLPICHLGEISELDGVDVRLVVGPDHVREGLRPKPPKLLELRVTELLGELAGRLIFCGFVQGSRGVPLSL